VKPFLGLVSAILLFSSFAADAVFPKTTFYRQCDLNVCHASPPTPLYSTPFELCYAVLSPNPLYSNIHAVPGAFGGVFACKANYPSCPVSVYPDGCDPGHSAGDIQLCPANSTASGAQCSCNANFQQAGNTCSGGKNNGAGPGGCATCPLGNPTNPANGNKLEQQEVVRGLNGFGLSLTFNSYDDVATRFGRRWRDSFNRRVLIDGSNAMVYRADGVALQFVPNAGAWIADSDVEDQLIELQNPPGTRTGWRLIAANGDELETYDAAGKLLSIQNRSGLTQTLLYSDGTSGPDGGFVLDANANPTAAILPAGLLIRAADHFGRRVAFGYNIVSRVIKVTDPGGGVYRFGYLNLEKLVTVTYPDNKVRTYVYNESVNTGGAHLPSALTGVFDENGDRLATFKYNAQERSISTEHAGTTLRYMLSYGAGSTTVTDPLNTARTYNFQSVLGAFKNTGITGPACPQCGASSQTPDANGNLASRIDWNGNRTNYTYDLARNLETSRTEGLTAAGAATPQTRTISTQWHATFRLATEVAEPLRITTNVYDADGMQCGARGALCSKTAQATSDANGGQGFAATPVGTARTWTTTYNVNGSVLTMNGPRTDVADITGYTYYANDDADVGMRGNLATVTNAVGHVTSITGYNLHGQPTTIVDANGLTTTLAYDLRQLLTSRTVGTEVTAYEYDGVGQLTKVTLPDGSYLSYTYDAAHRLTGMQDNLGDRIAYTLDAMGNRTQERVFDPGNTLAQTRSRVFNNLNRLFQELGALGQRTEYAYDNQGNVTSVKDPLDRITANAYDPLNRLRQVTDPSLGVTQYAYNGLDALTQVSDPRSLLTGYTVDGLGNLTQQVSPDTGTTANTYDVAGNLLTQLDAKGQTTTYAYDPLNRVALITFHDGSKQAYAYDQGTNALGRLSLITETNPANQVTSVIAYAYDPHGRVTTGTRTIAGLNHVTAYAYDSSGRMSGMSYPSGRTVSYGFDILGRVNQVSTTAQSQVVVQNVTYHPFGGVTGYTLGNGQIYARSVDQDGRIVTYTLGTQSYAIGYDAASRIAFISDVGTPANSNTYGYDALDRLTQAVLPATNYAYSYDAVGNRLSRTAGAGTDSYTYSSTSNRIASITPASGPVRNFGFDANGSTIGDSINTYAYDVRGRMVQATSVIGATNYQVNALGQRVRKTNSLGDTVFHYDTRGRLIAETDAAGNVVREYLHLGDIPIALARPGASGGGAEIVIDNGSAGFATTGIWPTSTAVAGFLGANYQSHAANGAPPSALAVDNTDPGFSATGTWPNSTAVSGYLGANYQVHAANGEPPSSIVADNAAGLAVGTWPNSTSVSGYLGSNYQVHTAGTGTNTFTWNLTVPSAGSYETYARWTQHPNRATNAKYTVTHAGGASVVTVNQEAGGGAWQLLGTYSFNAGVASISLSDEANDYVVADAVMLVPPGASPNTATWSVNVPSSGSYQVYARWTQHPNRATDAKYTVNHAGGATTVTVNQAAGGGTWSSLGSFSFNAGSASVSVTDRANGYVIADAVMFAPPGAGANSATWTPNVAQAGTYEVYARWTQHANRATNATYAVTHAGGTTAVAVNQQANGGIWNLLGTFSLSPGAAHKVTLTDRANGYVIADALKLVPVSLQTGPQYYYVHPDHLGTPRLIANASQQAVWRWDQAEPFGTNPADENPSGLGIFEFPMRLPAQYADKESNLHYNYFRDFDSAVGRYLQSDPIGLAGGQNVFTYVGSRPLERTDPYGLAYFAYRSLDVWGMPLGFVLVARILGTWNVGHEHLFFEDGASPPNLGFRQGGLFSEIPAIGYTRSSGTFDDCVMRIAVASTPVPASYDLLCSNCQDWAFEVRRQYAILASDPGIREYCRCRGTPTGATQSASFIRGTTSNQNATAGAAAAAAAAAAVLLLAF